MNNQDKYKKLAERFEKDAEDGFNQVPGSEDFFNGLKNPFTIQKNLPAKRAGNLRFLVFEVLMVLGLFFLLKYTWFKPAPKTKQTPAFELVEAPPVVPGAATEITEENLPVEHPAIRKKIAGRAGSNVKPMVMNNTDQSFVRPADTSTHGVDIHAGTVVTVKTDSTVNNVQSPLYHYADHRKKYRLVYVADMLAIDYRDTAFKAKLQPILNGTPASYESEGEWKKVKDTEMPVQAPVKNRYLEKLQKGMKDFRAGEFKPALDVFASILKENPRDQNALFYGALCLYEKEKYGKAMIMLDELSKVEEGIFEQDVDYYMALALLKNGNTKKASGKLKQIAHSDSFYSEKAKVLLKDLNSNNRE